MFIYIYRVMYVYIGNVEVGGDAAVEEEPW